MIDENLRWLKSILPSALLPNIKVWWLKPFWLRKDWGQTEDFYDGIITLPIHREQFYHCISGEGPIHVESVFHTQQENAASQPSPETPGLIETASIREYEGPSVLVVEDNPVNQKVAAGILEKLGCQVILAATGKQALQLVQETGVDCIVMDWELPEMDGLATTRAIRQLENDTCFFHKKTLWRKKHFPASSPIPRIPIIGLTAHVLPEHGQQGLLSGMDGYLTKPVHVQDLKLMLQRWVGFSSDTSSSVSSRPGECGNGHGSRQHFSQGEGLALDTGTSLEPSAEREEYDVSSALQALEGDKKLLYSLFELFNETSPGLIQAMHTSIGMHDRQLLQRQAHQMKGALNAVHAVHEVKLAGQLETLAPYADFSHLHSQTVQLERAIRKLLNVFQLIMRGKQGATPFAEK